MFSKHSSCRKLPAAISIPLMTFASYFLVEVFAALLLKPDSFLGFAFAACWSVLLAAVVLCLPRLAGRIVYGISYFAIALWTIAQAGYYQLFGKVMWLSDMRYADEGADFAEVLLDFPLLWWVGAVYLLGQGVAVILLLPKKERRPWKWAVAAGSLSVAGLFLLPLCFYAMDNHVWGAYSEYGRSTAATASYEVMYDSRRVYELCGIYQLTARDLWKHELYPLTPAYRKTIKNSTKELNTWFEARQEQTDPATEGIFHDKNVVLVLMESMDDWMISPQDTPTICRLMEEGINFTDFYTPGYGSVRTFNTEFCMNTGIFLPTTGSYVFDYVTNSFRQSLAGRLNALGYSSLAFHYNTDQYYSRGVFEPAMGYEDYVSYGDYTQVRNELYSDQYLFDNNDISRLFFREGQTLNFIITRSAHLPYQYNEVLNYLALVQYPQYRGLTGSEELDCARVKAKLVDDLFSRLLEELEAQGELENTVIIGVTDHYTYGFQDTELLMEQSGVADSMLLEKTPCFIWAADSPSIAVDKTLNTADLLPTVLHLLGCAEEMPYLGRNAFDPSYEGYAFFPDGSWISQGVACRVDADGSFVLVKNETEKELAEEYLQDMYARGQEFIHINNLLLISDYYRSSAVKTSKP